MMVKIKSLQKCDTFHLEIQATFSLMNVEVGLEGVLQGINEGVTVEADKSNPNNNNIQIVDVNLAMFGKIELKIESKIVENDVMNTAIYWWNNKRYNWWKRSTRRRKQGYD